MIDVKRLDELLEELYAIEPALRAQDVSLRRLAEELLASKPEAPVDERFIERLRRELLVRASRPKFSLMNFFTSKNRYFVPGLAMLVLAVVGAAVLQKGGLSRLLPSSNVASTSGIQRVEPNAFGKLALSSPDAHSAQAGDMAARSSLVAPESGTLSPEPASIAPTSLMPTMIGGGGGSVGGKLIAPDFVPTAYRYTYAGEAIEGMLTPQLDVYRRLKNSSNADALPALQGMNLGLIDLGKLRDAQTQSFTIAENRDKGYVFSIDVQEGVVSMNPNGKWLAPQLCASPACDEQNRLKEGDLLSDEETIRIADAFLAEYGIPKDGYGTPIVNAQWRVGYAALQASEKASYWFPETANVVYPILIGGKTVYDESGAPSGLNVGVDVRTKQVDNLYSLQTRSYQVSSYAGETDAKRLIGVAESTDTYGAMPENVKYTEIELGTPTVAYVRTWQTNLASPEQAELFVPALVFPVKNAPKDFWRQNVIVPLAKDVLDARVDNRPIPLGAPVMDAPTMRGSSSGGAPTTAPGTPVSTPPPFIKE